MKTFTKKEQIIILVIVLLIVAIFSFKFFFKEIIGNRDEFVEIDKNFVVSNGIIEDDAVNSESENEVKTIMVHISGAVHKPGVVELEEGKRLIDAVDLCGGLKDDADIDRINLAKKLADEEKIYIPRIGEEIPADIGFSDKSNNNTDNGKININTCSKAELMLLPGIGDALADRIIEYREKMPFKTIEDIKNVPGIGEKRFEAIKDLITVKWGWWLNGRETNPNDKEFRMSSKSRARQIGTGSVPFTKDVWWKPISWNWDIWWCSSV